MPDVGGVVRGLRDIATLRTELQFARHKKSAELQRILDELVGLESNPGLRAEYRQEAIDARLRQADQLRRELGWESQGSAQDAGPAVASGSRELRGQEWLDHLEQRLRANPGDIEALVRRGHYMYAEQRWDEALRDLSSAIKLAPDGGALAEAYSSRAMVLGHLERHDEAIRDYDEALALEPTKHWWHLFRGWELERSGRVDEALAAYSAAIERWPAVAEAYESRGRCRERQGHMEEALADYDMALDCPPEEDADSFSSFVSSWSRLDLLEKTGRVAEAVREVEHLIDTADANPWFPLSSLHWRRGLLLEERGRTKKALESLSKAIELEPEHPSYYSRRAGILEKLGRDTDALADLDRVVELKPHDGQAYVSRAWFHARMQRPSDAIDDLSRAILVHPSFAMALVMRGRFRAWLGQFDEALADCTTGIDLTSSARGSGFAWQYETRSMAYTLLGRLPEALDDLDRAIEADEHSIFRSKDSANLYEKRSLLRSALGHRDSAVADYAAAYVVRERQRE